MKKKSCPQDMLDFKFRNRAKIDSSGWKKTALWEGRENDKKTTNGLI